MAIVNIRNEKWDFVETGGVEVKMPEPALTGIELPRK